MPANNFLPLRIFLSCFFLLTCATALHAQSKTNLVLMPLDVSEQELEIESEYGSALQSGLKERYKVFYGASVEKVLEKEYEKIDCSAESCQQSVAIAFNAELVAYASVKNLGDGYLLKLQIKNALDDEVIETKTLPCQGCTPYSLIAYLETLGSGKQTDFQPLVTPGQANVQPVKADSNAILIFDSQPSGADIYIEDRKVGQTPYQGLNHKVGESLNARVKLKGYEAKEFDVSLDQPITQLEPIKLEKAKILLTVYTKPFKPDAVIYVNGEAKGVAPLQITTDLGETEIWAQSSDEKSEIVKLELTPENAPGIELNFRQANRLGLIVKDLSVKDVSEYVKEYAIREGVDTVVSVDKVKGGPALQGGIKEGDIITRFNNLAFKTAREFEAIVDKLPSDRAMPAVIISDDSPRFVVIRIDS